jgi:predicted amidohydrolase YtcJ
LHDPEWREVADGLSVAESKVPKETLIIGDIGPTTMDDPQATGASLDKLAPNHPVLLRTWCRHADILNGAGLAKFGINEDEPNPLGGRFIRSAENGKLTGLANEYAVMRNHHAATELTSPQEALQETRGAP